MTLYISFLRVIQIFDVVIQGDPKLRPPIPGRNQKCSMKTGDRIFKKSLSKEYLELFRFSALTNDPFFGEIKKSPFSPNFDPKIALKLPKERHDKTDTVIS